MCDEWMPVLSLPLTVEQFQQLPRNAAYRYEYCEGQALLKPRARFYHARLDLTADRASGPAAAAGVRLRPMCAEDFDELEKPFAAAFGRHQPFGSLEGSQQVEAARACLVRTRYGGDGPWVEEASFVAERPAGGPVGAVLITLLPEGDPADPDTYYWRQAAPEDSVARRLGQPHLTWIFVLPEEAAKGVGTHLLAASARELRRMGFTGLLTTFLLGNESSMLWHWRNGFELLSHPVSRQQRQRGVAS
jgi:GNAT superfamily N-acetyltransferase